MTVVDANRTAYQGEYVGQHVVYAVSAWSFGRLSDRIDRRRLLALGIVFLIAADVALPAASSLWSSRVTRGRYRQATSEMPTLAKIVLRAAKHADSSAQKIQTVGSALSEMGQ